MAGEKVKVENFNISKFATDSAWISNFETIEEAYYAGVSEQEAVLDKIRAEIVHLHDWAFDRDGVLKIIDKYRAK